jgi:predicted nuclease of predicted toxin-antitoxin system
MRLLLDVHLPLELVTDLQSKGVDVAAVANHRGGTLREADDPVLLTAAREEDRVFVTYDLSTIPVLLVGWAEEGLQHAGVIFIHHRTIPQGNYGCLLRALLQVVADWGHLDWTNRCAYLRRASTAD